MTLKDEIIESYAKGRSSFCAQDIDNLRKWVKNETMFEKAYYLTDEGYEELLGIGRRLREAYPHFLSNLESGSYTFRSGYGHWMENSAKAFVEGLAGDINNIVIENPRSDYDFITVCKLFYYLFHAILVLLMSPKIKYYLAIHCNLKWIL